MFASAFGLLTSRWRCDDLQILPHMFVGTVQPRRYGYGGFLVGGA